MTMRRLQGVLLLIGGLLTAPAIAAGTELIPCARWSVSPADVMEAGRFRVHIPGRGPTMVRARGVDAPRSDGACSLERFQAKMAAAQTTVSLANAGVVAFCAPTDTEAGVVEATVLVDGVDLQRILADAKLAQPSNGTANIDWCAR